MLIYGSRKRKVSCHYSANYYINVIINPTKEGESYKYLGQDKNLGYIGPVNKERVANEYYKHVKKIWKSELSAYIKHVAHTAFAVPVLIPTSGLLN